MLKKSAICLKSVLLVVRDSLPLPCRTFLARWMRGLKPRRLPADLQHQLRQGRVRKVNLCCGPVILEDFINVDIDPRADVVIDLEKDLLPFDDHSVEILVCIFAINYFSCPRAAEIIQDVHRVLRPGGVARFASQDLRILAEKYLKRDADFYFQRLPDDRARFPGETFADKFNYFFYGFPSTQKKHCQYVYDFEALKALFNQAGFKRVEPKEYLQSAIPGIEQIDNRPEQMFFLEAVKDDVSVYADQARSLWAQGRKEEAWACILYAFNNGGHRKDIVESALGMMTDQDGYENRIALIEAYVSATGDKTSFADLWQAALRKRGQAPFLNIIKSACPLLDTETIGMRRRLDVLDQRHGQVLSDREHLDACMRWLKRMLDHSQDDGVPAIYDALKKKWYSSYPETTGYIIPSFLAYGRLTGDSFYLSAARKMGDWQVRIQLPDGGAGEPLGEYAAHPRVFNTGQVMLGWLALYKETQDEKYLQGLRKAADFLVSNLEPDGAWVKNTFQGSKVYHSRVAWVLLELYTMTGRREYQEAAEKAVNWCMSQARPNGWFASNGFRERYASTHLIAYAYVGLMKIYGLHNADLPYERIEHILTTAASRLAEIYRKKEIPLGFRDGYDGNWKGHGNFSCLTGNVQIAYFLKEWGHRTGEESLIATSDAIVADSKRRQVLNQTDDENLSGGLFGCHPVNGAYAPYQMPNWGVKFFADALLQRLLKQEELYGIG